MDAVSLLASSVVVWIDDYHGLREKMDNKKGNIINQLLSQHKNTFTENMLH